MGSRGRGYGLVAPVLHAAARGLLLHRVDLARPVLVRRVSVDARLGVRITLVADLHAHRVFGPPSRMREVVDLVNGIPDVDLVALPGDFVGHDVTAIDWTAEALARLRAPAVATLGNHDHMEGAERIATALAGSGIEVVTGRAWPVPGRPRVEVVGVDSLWAGAPDPGSIDALVSPGASAIVLGHEPAIATLHSQVLHVAGHTHHGQVRIPGRRAPYLPRHSHPYPEGLATIGDGAARRFVYTTAGVGSTTIPLRVGAPAEIVVIDA